MTKLAATLLMVGANVLVVSAGCGRTPLAEKSTAAQNAKPGFSFVVRHMDISFRKPAHMDDVLEIVTTPSEVKGASVTLHQRVSRGEDLIVEAHVQVAFVSGGRAKPIPKPLRIAMKADQEAGGESGAPA